MAAAQALSEDEVRFHTATSSSYDASPSHGYVPEFVPNPHSMMREGDGVYRQPMANVYRPPTSLEEAGAAPVDERGFLRGDEVTEAAYEGHAYDETLHSRDTHVYPDHGFHPGSPNAAVYRHAETLSGMSSQEYGAGDPGAGGYSNAVGSPGNPRHGPDQHEYS